MSFLKKKKQKSKIFGLKSVILLLSIALNAGGLLSVSTTVASYLDVETSSGNLFEAGSIDFALISDELVQINFAPGASLAQEVSMDDFSSLPFQYFVTSDNFGGDSDFCSALDAEAIFASSSLYFGKLNVLETPVVTAIDDWLFNITFPGTEEFENKYCAFDLVYGGWQTMHIPNFGDGGFNDVEIVSNRIDSWGTRLNKVYYDVAPDRGEETFNEWVELYNQTDQEVDISDWFICDDESCDALIGMDVIPAYGFAIISVSESTWGEWQVPDDFIKFVVSDEAIGDGLDNDADMLQLRRGDGFVVDQMNWGEPDDSWTNYNDDVWSPGAVDVDEGSTLGRIPNGFDTNVAEDWHGLGSPSVNLIDPNQSGTLTWYWGSKYDINWEAVNPNGDDSELLVDIYYIKDIDHDGEISVGDTVHLIFEDTENDGTEEWTVPKGFLGYIWIKIVVSGPENPLLNDFMISGKIYDPFPLELWEESPEEVIDSLLEPDSVEGEVLSKEEVEVFEEEVVEGEVLGEAVDVEEEVPLELTDVQAHPTSNGMGEVVETEIETEMIEEEVIEEVQEPVVEEELIEGVEEELVESIDKKEEELSDPEGIIKEDVEPEPEQEGGSEDELPVIKEDEEPSEVETENEIDIVPETIEKSADDVGGEVVVEEIVEAPLELTDAQAHPTSNGMGEVVEYLPVAEEEPVLEIVIEELPVIDIEDLITEE